MKFFLTVALAGVALCQQGSGGPDITPADDDSASVVGTPGNNEDPDVMTIQTDASTSDDATATDEAAEGESTSPTASPTPAPVAKKGGKKGKKAGKKGGKKGKSPAPSPAPADEATISTPEVQTDKTCAGQIGALWCAAKQKCLRAWEEPCPAFGADTQTHVQVKSTTEPAVTVSVAVPATVSTPAAVTTTPARPIYNGAALYPGAPQTQALYPGVSTQALYPGVSTQPLYPGAAPARPLYPGAPATPIYTSAPAQATAPQAGLPLYGLTANAQAGLAPIGGQRDAGGCATGGGYSFCASLNKCVRPWETPCPAGGTPAVGGQTDNGGCLTGAGYSFCASLGRCVRPWETPCPGASAQISAQAQVNVPAAGPIGGQTDNGGCLTGAGYSYCATLGRCVRVWETPCPAT